MVLFTPIKKTVYRLRFFDVIAYSLVTIISILFGFNTYVIAPLKQRSQTISQNITHYTIRYNQYKSTKNSKTTSYKKLGQLSHRYHNNRLLLIQNYFTNPKKYPNIDFAQVAFLDNIPLSIQIKRDLGKMTQKSTLTLTLLGRYQDLNTYIKKIQKLPLLFTYQEIKITPDTPKSLLKLNLKINLYWYMNPSKK